MSAVIEAMALTLGVIMAGALIRRIWDVIVDGQL